MFGFGKKKHFTVAAPVEGNILDITEVADDVFSTKMMGDGFAVEPAGDTVKAPCDGTVKLLAHTLHAVAIEREGVELLIHVGLDTVELEGKGFQALTKQGRAVKAGDPLVQFDRAAIEAAGKKLTTMLVVTNGDDKVKQMTKHLDNPAAVLDIEYK